MISSASLYFLLTTLITRCVLAEDLTFFFMDNYGRTFDMETNNLADFRLRLGSDWSPFWYSSYYMTIKTKSDHRISLRMESVDDDGCDAHVSLYSNRITTSNAIATYLCRESDYEEDYITSNDTLIIKYWASFFASENNFEFIITSFYQLTENDIDCPNVTTFNCGNERCINESLLCNDKNNCGNDVDEEDCHLWVAPVLITLFVLALLSTFCCIVYLCKRSKKKRQQQQGRVVNQSNQAQATSYPPQAPAVTFHNRPGVQHGTSPTSQPSQSVYIHQAPGVYVPGQYPPSPPQANKYPGNQSVTRHPPAPTAGFQQHPSGYHNLPGQVLVPPGQSLPGYQTSPGQSPPGYQPLQGQPPPGYQTSPGQQPPSGYQTSPGHQASGYQTSSGHPPSGYQVSQGQFPPGYQASPGQPPSGYQASPGQPPSGYQASPGQSLSGYQASPEKSPSGQAGYNVTPSSSYQPSPSRSQREITPRAPPPAIEGYSFAPTFESSAEKERKGGI